MARCETCRGAGVYTRRGASTPAPCDVCGGAGEVVEAPQAPTDSARREALVQESREGALHSAAALDELAVDPPAVEPEKPKPKKRRRSKRKGEASK